MASTSIASFIPFDGDLHHHAGDERQFSAFGVPLYSAHAASQDRPRCSPMSWSDRPELTNYHAPGHYIDYSPPPGHLNYESDPRPLSWLECRFPSANNSSPLFPVTDTGVSPKCFSPLTSESSVFESFFPSPSQDYQSVNVFDLTFAESLLPSDSSCSPAEYYEDRIFYSQPSASRSESYIPSSSCSSSPSSQTLEIHSPVMSPTLSPSPPTPLTPISKPKPDNTSRRRFPCLIPDCARRFTSQYTLKVHMEAHKPKPRVSFPCTLGCSERFSRQHDRLRHEVAKHNKVCEFLCDDCGRFFSTNKTLGNHKCPLAQGGTRWVHT